MNIYGRNQLLEVLETSPSRIYRVYFKKVIRWNRLPYVVSLLKKNNIFFKFVSMSKNYFPKNVNHQGVNTFIKLKAMTDFYELMNETKTKNNFLCILSGIYDPINFGAIIRSAVGFSVTGLIYEKRYSAPVTDTVYRTSSGYIEKLNLCEVSNINRAIDEVKANGFFVCGLDIDGDDIKDIELSFPLCIIIGTEDRGIPEHTKKRCDRVIKICVSDRVNSLNVSVAAGIMFYEIELRKKIVSG